MSKPKKKPAKRGKDFGTGAKQRGYARFRKSSTPAEQEARASVSLDGETRSGCPTCGACSPPMSAAEREVVEAANRYVFGGYKYSELNAACCALRAERERGGR